MTAALLHPASPAPSAALSPADLAELFSTFREAAAKLEGTHDVLRGEVARLESELREANQQLKRARQLAALGEMAAGIAHEVRNPLGSIRLYAGMLSQDLADRPAERDIAVKIASAVSRLDAVVRDVLAFSREIAVRPEPCAAPDLLRDAADACADLSRGAGVPLVIDAASDAVRCDPVLMHQALTNVVRNALEAVASESAPPPHGVWLTAARRRAAGPDGRRERMAVLAVRDSGPGVPGDVLPRVFNPFFTTRHSGTGLGLAIVHRIIDAHGGRVALANNTRPGPRGEPPRGATVEFLIPDAEPADADRPTTPEAA
jgi:signal transduction histidine kinase